MGYARLTIANNLTVLATSVLHDIVGCVTGQFSSSAQLRVANSASSEIVNTLGQNWTIAHPSGSFVPTTPNNTLASWVLAAPCVNSPKTKFVRLTNYYNQNTGANQLVNTGTGTLNSYGTNGSTISSGILIQACTSASNSTTLVSPSWYNTSANGNNQNVSNAFTGTTIIISWSSRHLVIWSNGSSATSDLLMSGLVEFPETDVTTARGILPVAMLIERNASLYSTITSYAPTNYDTRTYGDIQIPDFYNISTATTGGTSLVGIATTLDTLNSNWTTAKSVNTIPTIDASGNNRVMLMPLIISMFSRGLPSMYLSALSNMYVVPNGLGTGGDTITVGSDTYVYLPSSTGMSFVVRRG